MRSTQYHKRITNAQYRLDLLQRNQLVKRDSALVCRKCKHTVKCKRDEIRTYFAISYWT